MLNVYTDKCTGAIREDRDRQREIGLWLVATGMSDLATPQRVAQFKKRLRVICALEKQSTGKEYWNELCVRAEESVGVCTNAEEVPFKKWASKHFDSFLRDVQADSNWPS